MLLGGEAAKGRVLDGRHGRLGDDDAAADHGEEVEHAVGHVGGLEGEGHEGGETGVALGAGGAGLAEGVVERVDGLDAVGEGLGGVVGRGVSAEVEVGGGEAEHGVDEEVKLLHMRGLFVEYGEFHWSPTPWERRATSFQTSSPPMGRGGYAVSRKCWKKRRSSMENWPGVDESVPPGLRIGPVDIMAPAMAAAAATGLVRGYSHWRPRRRQ